MNGLFKNVFKRLPNKEKKFLWLACSTARADIRITPVGS